MLGVSAAFSKRLGRLESFHPAGRSHTRATHVGIAGPAVSGWMRVALVAGAIMVSALPLSVMLRASFLGVAVAVAIAFAGARAVVWLFIERPLASIAEALETLAARDIGALGDALAAMSMGESPRALRVNAQPVGMSLSPPVRRVATAVNVMIRRLEVSSKQFNHGTDDACRRAFYVGPDDYLLGASAAEYMGSRLPSGGDVLVLSGRFDHSGMELRRRGFEGVIADQFPSLRVAGTCEDKYDPDTTYALVSAFLRAHPALAGIYSTEAVGVHGAIRALEDAGIRNVVVVCHDLVADTMTALMGGQLAATVFQDPFGQGYDVAIHLFNHVAFGWQPPDPRILTNFAIVTREKCTDYWVPFVGPVEPAKLAPSRARPLGPAPRHVRIAILGVDDNAFWRQIGEGVDAARETLSSLNATVERLNPDPAFDVAIRGPEIERLAAEGYDAIATPLFDLALTSYINHAISLGTAVATFNSEAVSLREIISSLSRQRRRLETAATNLEVVACRDALTGAANRYQMDQDLEQLSGSIAETGETAALVMLDIDHFKQYNDTFGHPAGDDVLRRVAATIQHEIRPMDGLYRCGGEEFLVVLRRVGLAEARPAADRILTAVASMGIPHPGNPPWAAVTISAGVSILIPGSAIAEVLAEADSALYVAKRGGRNRLAAAAGG